MISRFSRHILGADSDDEAVGAKAAQRGVEERHTFRASGSAAYHRRYALETHSDVPVLARTD